jgi:hypothetical protein
LGKLTVEKIKGTGMKRVLIIGFALTLMLSISAFATETRTITMGQNDGIMVDDYNMFRFPGRIVSYPNIAVAEFQDSGEEFYKFGINWKFGEDNPWVLGTHFINESGPYLPSDYYGNDLTSNNYANFFSGTSPTDPAEIEDLDSPNHRIDLLYGRKLGSNDFGLRFEYIHSSVKDDVASAGTPSDQSEEKHAIYSFTLGLTEGTAGEWDLALGVWFGSWTDKDEDGFDETKPDGYYELWAEGRYFWVRNPTVTLVPHGGIAFGKRGVKNFGDDPDPATPGDDFNATNDGVLFNGGFGMNYTPSSNLLAVGDLGIMYNSVKTKIDSNTTPQAQYEYKYSGLSILYFKIGLEADVFRWMDVRFGATSYWDIETLKYEDNSQNVAERKYAWADNETYLGLAFHWGRLHVDTYMDPNFVIRMPYFISGDNTNDMNFRVSALYEMF